PERREVPAQPRAWDNGGRAPDVHADDRRVLHARHRRLARRSAGEDPVLERLQAARRVVGLTAAVLGRRRATAFAVAAGFVLAWFLVAPHLPHVRVWPAILLVAILIIPGTLLLVLIALPAWDRRWMFGAVVLFALLALVFSLADWGLPANFAKLAAAVCAGWAFLALFEQLSWVVIVACAIPVVDIVSVW